MVIETDTTFVEKIPLIAYGPNEIPINNENNNENKLDKSQQINCSTQLSYISGFLGFGVVVAIMSILWMLFYMYYISPNGQTVEQYFKGIKSPKKKGHNPLKVFFNSL